jgi:hypothetical protein
MITTFESFAPLPSKQDGERRTSVLRARPALPFSSWKIGGQQGGRRGQHGSSQQAGINPQLRLSWSAASARVQCDLITTRPVLSRHSCIGVAPCPVATRSTRGTGACHALCSSSGRQSHPRPGRTPGQDGCTNPDLAARTRREPWDARLAVPCARRLDRRRAVPSLSGGRK